MLVDFASICILLLHYYYYYYYYIGLLFMVV